MKEDQNKLKSLSNFKFYKSLQDVSPLAKASASFVATAILIISLFFMFIQPAFAKITELKSQIDILTNLNNKLTNKKKTLINLKKDYLELQNLTAMADQAVPSQNDFNLFDKQMRFLVLKNGLEWDSLGFTGFDLVNDVKTAPGDKTKPNIKEEKKIDNVSSVDFNLSAYGSYENLKSFIEDLQSLVRVIKINNIDMDLGRDQQQLDFKLNGSIFYQDLSQ